MEKSLEQHEELYLRAKEAYYTGAEELMSDEEFDELEEYLRQNGSEVIETVGAFDRNYKHLHLSPMLSLSKASATLDGQLPITIMQKWFSDFPDETIFEATPKYDGNAVNLIYKFERSVGKAFFIQAITRGDKIKGRDVTEKFRNRVPYSVNVDKDIEVRGEAVMPTEIFENKYKNFTRKDGTVKVFKNSRNFIAGVLNRDEIDIDTIEEMEFVAVEVRLHDGDYEYPKNTQEWLKLHGFNKKESKHIYFKASEFESVYSQMKLYREQECSMQLDGFVIKADEQVRKKYGESGHHPNWAIAIKFPPKKTVTRILSFRWNVGTTGEITPIAQLDPVDLDGTTIRNVAAFNLGFIRRMKIYPGAEVIIAKSGDIIPQIVKVEKEGNLCEVHPKFCPICGAATEVHSIHLFCPNEDCEGKLFKKFLIGVRVTRMQKFGTVTCQTLYDSGYKSIVDIFDPEKFNKEKLIATGNFKEGRTLDSLLNEIESLKVIPHYRVILALGFSKIGLTAAKQLAKKLDGQKYSFSGLEKAAVEGFEKGEFKYERVEEFKTILKKRGIDIESEVEITDGIGCEFTGSPKSAGFKTKSELEKFLASKGYVHKSLKEAKLLLTDSMSSNSSKMEYAIKNGIEIMTYDQFVLKF